MSIKPDPKNANKGTQRGRGMLESSLRQYGAGRSVLADKHGVLIAGNKTMDVAAELGIPHRIIQTDGHELIVVQRTDLDLATDTAAKELGIADNRVGQVSLDWDVDVLAELSAEVDLSGFWHDWELGALLGGEDANDPNAEWVGMPEFENDQLEAKQVVVKFTRTEDVERFAKALGQTVTMDTKSIWYPARQTTNTDKAFVGDES